MPVGAGHLLKARAIWIFPLIVGSIAVVLITAFYVGSVVNPVGHLHGLPVALVNQDHGGTAGTRRVDFGQQVQACGRGALPSQVGWAWRTPRVPPLSRQWTATGPMRRS